MFTLPELNYDYDSLSPHIDARTMEIHHSKHHQAYINSLNTALESYPDLLEYSVENLLREIRTLPEAIQTAVQNHAGGHANHSLFWEVLTPNGSAISDYESLVTEINQTFGSFESFKDKFNQTAVSKFGSGWGWLVVTVAGDLEILATSNQDSPLMQGLTPILGIDVWEHAYYLQYQNRRLDYLTQVWEVINWKQVESRLFAARSA
jgi:superoxide dismutase, Fe-Mn family